MDKLYDSEKSKRFNSGRTCQSIDNFMIKILTCVHKRFIMLNTVQGEALLSTAYGGYMEQFREKVKELRVKMDWAQEDLAREIDVSLSTVQRWEGKGAKPTRHSRRELAKLFQEVGIGDG